MNRLLISVLMALTMLVHLPSVLAQESDWPRTLPLNDGLVTIYSLQVDDMTDDIIHFRAALAYRETPDAEPVFGAGWFESRVEIDTQGRIVHPTDLKVTETRFPDGTDDLQSDLSSVLEQQSGAWNLDFSLDHLEASLKTAEAESIATQSLNTAPPRIIYRDQPALLISIDGDPILREIENSSYQAVINTPYPLIYDGRRYYLNAAKNVWYRATKATGPYRFDKSPPKDIVAMVNASDTEMADEQDFESVTAANAPEIVVSTEPAELIVTEGPAAFVPLVDDLLVLQNSEDDVFMHVSSQNFYIVLSGRWYQASSLNGPWFYQPSDELPVAFANIPQESSQADSRVYVAGTQEARDAVLDAHVPQTAAVARGEVDIEVKYDGKPIYQPVDGTGLVYIENTGSTVLKSEGLYYLVEKGVWYVSPSPKGPWQVSDHRPVQVETILPTSPVYNVKYVHVYHSTPNVVYVGYTPGYTGSYVYHNTVLYGSGWHHRPWVSPHYYYPRLSTWGFHASYNSWSGWNYGLSWGLGPFSISYFSGGYWHHGRRWHHGHYGGWGPRGYRSRPVHYRSGHKRYAHQANRRDNHGRGDNRGNRRSDNRSNYNDRNDNLYRDDRQRARLVDNRNRSPRAPARSNPDRSNRGSSVADIRRANYTGASNDRQSDHKKIKDGEGNRIGPVNPSDLRLKAKVRDANFEAGRNRLIADNNGNVYRGRDRDLKETVGNKKGNAGTRYANNTGNGNDRQSNHTKIKNGERNRISPVHVSDLNLKAKVRDANFEASRNRLVADNNGNVYRGQDRNRDMKETVGNKNGLVRREGNRTTSRPRDKRQDISQGNGRTRDRSSSPGYGNKGSERTTRSTQVASLQRPPTRSSENVDRSRSSKSVNNRVRPSTPEPSRKNSSQRSPRELSAQARVREGSRTDSQQKSSAASSRKQSTSGKSTQRETAQKSGKRRNDSKSGGKRASARRSRG